MHTVNMEAEGTEGAVPFLNTCSLQDVAAHFGHQKPTIMLKMLSGRYVVAGLGMLLSKLVPSTFHGDGSESKPYIVQVQRAGERHIRLMDVIESRPRVHVRARGQPRYKLHAQPKYMLTGPFRQLVALH